MIELWSNIFVIIFVKKNYKKLFKISFKFLRFKSRNIKKLKKKFIISLHQIIGSTVEISIKHL